MQATESLRKDHVLIEKMLKVLNVTADLISSERRVPHEIINQSIDFVNNFTNVCHHGKEEQTLFPALERGGMPREGGPIARMIFEHKITKELADRLDVSAKEYLSSNASEPFVQDIKKYVEHVSSHLAKENLRLFVMADMMLNSQTGQLNAELESSEATSLEKLGKSRSQYEQFLEKAQTS